ncbi:MAG: outer membrane protein assembly factor BamB [Arenicellales bacterium WSBS_2016_MAG_OTU3]
MLLQNNAGKILIALSCIAVLTGCSNREKVRPEKQMVEAPNVESVVPLKQVWRYGLSEGKTEGAILSPAVQADLIFGANPSGKVVAIDSTNGKTRWERKLKRKVRAGVGLGEGLVLVGTVDGEIVAIANGTGATEWEANIGRAVLTAPMVGRGIVIVRTVDGLIIGLSAISGKEQWRVGRNVPSLTLHGSSRPLIDGRAFVAGFASGKIVAADLDTGRELWDFSVGRAKGSSEIEQLSDIDADPVLVDSTLYLATYQSQVVALSLTDQRIIWQRDISTYRSPAVDAGSVYIAGSEGSVSALDAKTGEMQWEQSALQGREVSSMVVLEDFVAVGDIEGYLYLLNKSDGSFASRKRAGRNAIRSVSGLDENRLLVTSVDGSIAVYAVH